MKPQLMLPDSEATAKTCAAILARKIEAGLCILIEDGMESEARAFTEIPAAPGWSGCWNALFWGFVKAWREQREEIEAENRMIRRIHRRHEEFLLSLGIDPSEEHAFHLQQAMGLVEAFRGIP